MSHNYSDSQQDNPACSRLHEVLHDESFEDVLIFERCTKNLNSLLQIGTRLASSVRLHIARQLFCGIQYLHDSGVLHRDIKPANILIADQCVLKLCDLGLARYKQDGSLLCTTIGTPFYRAPELCAQRRPEDKLDTEISLTYDESVDLWSAGIVLAELYLRPHWRRICSHQAFRAYFSMHFPYLMAPSSADLTRPNFDELEGGASDLPLEEESIESSNQEAVHTLKKATIHGVTDTALLQRYRALLTAHASSPQIAQNLDIEHNLSDRVSSNTSLLHDVLQFAEVPMAVSNVITGLIRMQPEQRLRASAVVEELGEPEYGAAHWYP